MAPASRRSPRGTDALSRERIVAAAVELLDGAGEGGLTFRALSEHLATGPGAIYWHVANKEELLDAATDGVVTSALAGCRDHPPRDAVRAVALSLFDAVDAHPWLAGQLSIQLPRRPWGPVTLQILEGLGRPLGALGVPRDAWFSCGTALMHYVLGAAGQNAANAANVPRPRTDPGARPDRATFLAEAATAWEALDPDRWPFVRSVAGALRDHDDREQFLAGVDLLLSGVAAVDPGAT